MSMWSLYDHPSDFPNSYIARRWEIRGDGHFPTGDMLISADLEGLENQLERMGLVKLMRMEGDDPVIMSTWL